LAIVLLRLKLHSRIVGLSRLVERTIFPLRIHEEKMMKTKAILPKSREGAMALALSLVLAIPSVALIGAGWVQAQTPQAQSQAAAPKQQAANPDFVCQAQPGSWCDLRDWRGFGQPVSQPDTK
jgi:hypothetical protein